VMVLGTGLLAMGVLVLMISCWGLFVFKDSLSRQHAATKAGSLGLVLIVLGGAALGGHWGWWLRAIIIVLLIWITMPIASHVLARAALQENGKKRPDPDDV